MKIRILKGFSGYKPGQEFDWADGMARVLVARGMVEPIREDVVEHAVVEERAEQAVVTQKKRAK